MFVSYFCYFAGPYPPNRLVFEPVKGSLPHHRPSSSSPTCPVLRGAYLKLVALGREGFQYERVEVCAQEGWVIPR